MPKSILKLIILLLLLFSVYVMVDVEDYSYKKFVIIISSFIVAFYTLKTLFIVYGKIIKKEENLQQTYSKIDKADIDEQNRSTLGDKNLENNAWLDIINLLATNNKSEVYTLIKKFDLSESFNIAIDGKGFSNIIRYTHILDLLFSIKEAIRNIKEDNKTRTRSLEWLKDKIYFYRKEKFNFSYKFFFVIIVKIVIFFAIWIFAKLLIDLFAQDNLNYIYSDFFSLLKDIIFNIDIIKGLLDSPSYRIIYGIAIVSISPFLTFFIYYCYRKITLTKDEYGEHSSWLVIIEKIITYAIFMSLFVVVLYSGIGLINSASLESRTIFDFMTKMILPTLTICDIDNILTIKSKESIFLMFALKTVVILIVANLWYIFAKHIIEKYIEFYDNSKNKTHLIPSEFLKIFSYLIIGVITIVLIYGVYFIQYPKIIKQYNSYENKGMISKICKDSNKTINVDNNSSKQKNNVVFQEGNNTIYLNISTDNKDSNISINSPINKKVPTSITDYIPLSIFLTLFGGILLMATKDLLENYFAGLSLRVDEAYEVGERVKINDSEMLEVKELGFRADKFYGINSNTIITIPYKKLILSNIINYSQPTLDYRQKITIYFEDKMLEKDKNMPRELEKILLLSAFINTGVKIPKLKLDKLIENKKKNGANSTKELENLKNKLDEYREKLQNYMESNKKEDGFVEYDKYIDCEKEHKSEINDIWVLFTKNSDIQENLFLKEINSLIKDTSTDDTEDIKTTIKKIVVSILLSINEYESKIKKGNYKWHLDQFCARRKYRTFRDIDYAKLDEIANLLVNISYYYFALTKHIWRLKNRAKANIKKTKIDKITVPILDVPRVETKHNINDNGLYWEANLLITAELGEQSGEVIHHINMYIDELIDIYFPPHFKKHITRKVAEYIKEGLNM